jgi:hypothetical protein
MGRMFAEGLIESGMSLEDAISLHLTSNHYPPVPTIMVSVCIEAIDAYNEGDSGREITLPDGVSYRGSLTAPAWAIIEGHHLETWLDLDEQ